MHYLLQACAFHEASFSDKDSVCTSPDTGISAHFAKHMRSTDVGSFVLTWRVEILLYNIFTSSFIVSSLLAILNR